MKPCKKCGGIERHASGGCKNCRSEYNKKYCRTDKAKLIAKKSRLKNYDKYLSKSKEYRDINKEKVIAATKKWREYNQDKVKSYLERTKDSRSEAGKKYYHKNGGSSIKKICPVYNRLQRHERRLIEKRAKPEWNNQFFMEEAFDLAILREKCLGIKYHVDHVIPLKNKVVSGLHSHTNIAVIPAILNIRKQTRLIEVKPY